MKKLAFTISMILCFISCIDHKIPKANIQFEEVIKNKLENIYYLSISSDINIDSLLIEKGGKPRIICPLGEKGDFTEEDIKDFNSFIIGMDFKKNNSSKSKYENQYITEINFIDNTKKRLSERFLNKDEIVDLIKSIKCLSCKIEYRFFMDTRKPYLSNSMCIPVENMLKVIE